jgi:hypothetical protein
LKNNLEKIITNFKYKYFKINNKITFLLCSTYGNHLSIKTDCGLAGIGANLSTTTFLGGAGNLFP